MLAQPIAVYPSQYETDILLKDGTALLLRPIRKNDVPRWLAFVNGLSARSRNLRFHHFVKDFTPEHAARFCSVDYKNTFAFVAEASRNGDRRIVAVGRYYRLPRKDSAEIAIVTDDAYQGQGIGSNMMTWLTRVARDNGISRFEADVLTENAAALEFFRDYGFHVTSTREGGVAHITMPIARTRIITRKEEERERIATVASLRPVLYPQAVAVIGASRDPESLGFLTFQCMMQSGYNGTVYPVNPNAGAVMAVKAYPSIMDISGPVDMAIIVVPAPLVSHVADECGRKGVRALIVISDGFKERGPEGAIREQELREIALGHGMRLVGPNCMGIINTDPALNMNATFSTTYPPAGNVAFLSQSGAIGLVILQYATMLNMGISTFISVGNRADVSSNDMLYYWEQDPRTDVILLYMESFGNPRKFSRIARQVAAKKPILAVKGGRTDAGSRAASSHTGALATPGIATDALFHEAGIIRLNAIEELFDVAEMLSNQPLPAGRRLAILTNGGGPGIIAADAAASAGLELPELSAATSAALKPRIKRDIQFNNPLDLTAGGTAGEFEGALRVLASDSNFDAVLLIFIPPVLVHPETMTAAVSRVATLFRTHRKPLLACFMGQKGLRGNIGCPGNRIPCYLFPESAINALARAVEYTEIRRQPRGRIPHLAGIKRPTAQRIIQTALCRTTARPLWLTPSEIAGLLNAYGIRFAAAVSADSAPAAARAASEVGFPVAVKLASGTITHKSDIGGVVLGLKSATEVEAAYSQIRDKISAVGREKEIQGVIVQHMVEGGIEAIVGMTQDPSLGPLILFGLGGVYTELVQDVALKLHPLTDLSAAELVHSPRMSRLFEGYRGSPPSDTVALQDLLLRLSAMVEDIPQIHELDFNPVKVMPMGQGYRVIDARIALS